MPPLHVSPTEVVFVLLVLAGLVIQSLLLRRAHEDIASFRQTLREYGARMEPEVRQFFTDALLTAVSHRDQAIGHVGIQIGGVLLGIWSFFVPEPVRSEVSLFSLVAGLYILLVFTVLDVVAYRDYRIREHQKRLRWGGQPDYDHA